MAVVINAIILYVLVSIFADSMQGSTRWKVLGIAMAIVIGEAAVGYYVENEWVRLSFFLVAMPVLVAFLLVVWCGLARRAAIKIAALYTAIRAAILIAFLVWAGE
jgi:hypothetical protein